MIEAERQMKVLNMMITAHSVLRDRYYRMSAIFENCLLVAAVILNALVFVDNKFITKFTMIAEDSQKLISGIASITVFTISVVLLQVKWKAKAENHLKAASQLFKLLQELREILQLVDSNEKNIQLTEFSIKYAQISSTLTQIPERKFNALKLIHYRKIELSKLIDKHPGSILLILKIRLFLSSFKEKRN